MVVVKHDIINHYNPITVQRLRSACYRAARGCAFRLYGGEGKQAWQGRAPTSTAGGDGRHAPQAAAKPVGRGCGRRRQRGRGKRLGRPRGAQGGPGATNLPIPAGEVVRRASARRRAKTILALAGSFARDHPSENTHALGHAFTNYYLAVLMHQLQQIQIKRAYRRGWI